MTHVMKSAALQTDLQKQEGQASVSNDRGKPSKVSNPLMFLRRWAANPLQMGSIVPSAPALCKRVARQMRRNPDQFVVELGAGTGVISKALLDAGLPPEKLYVVEIVHDMAEHLRSVLPGVNVVEGDARELAKLLPDHVRGNIGTVVCGVPLVLLPLAEQRRFIDAIQAVAPGVGFLAYSYCVTSPLPHQKHGLSAKREEWTPRNFPPASVWRYTPVR